MPLWPLLSLSLLLHGLALFAWAWLAAGPNRNGEIAAPRTALLLVAPAELLKPTSLPRRSPIAATIRPAADPKKKPLRSIASSKADDRAGDVAPLETTRPLATIPSRRKIVDGSRFSSPDLLLRGSANAATRGPARGVVLILDVSGSMYESYAGTTRLELARALLLRRLHALPVDTPFRLILYAHRARVSGSFVPANPATLAAAEAWLREDFNGGGGTNLAAAFSEAALLPAAQWIVATDGDLHVCSAELIALSQQALSAFPAHPTLTVEAIAPRPNTGDRALLQRLAESTHATYDSFSGLPNLVSLNDRSSLSH